MSDTWLYYLHENGDVIGKNPLPGVAADLMESSFVRHWWTIHTGYRADAWRLVVEAMALGARKERADEMAAKWGLTDDDGLVFGQHAGLRIFQDGNAWCATFSDFVNIQESQVGFGATVLEALVDLCKGGMQASKHPWSRPRRGNELDAWRAR